MSKATAKPAAKEATGSETKFKRGKALVVPSLSIADMKEGESLYIQFQQAPVTKPQTDKAGKQKIDDDGETPLNITTAQVIDLNTGALGEMVLPFMVCKGLANVGSPEQLVGKKFEFVKGKKKARTILWSVYELE